MLALRWRLSSDGIGVAELRRVMSDQRAIDPLRDGGQLRIGRDIQRRKNAGQIPDVHHKGVAEYAIQPCPRAPVRRPCMPSAAPPCVRRTPQSVRSKPGRWRASRPVGVSVISARIASACGVADCHPEVSRVRDRIDRSPEAEARLHVRRLRIDRRVKHSLEPATRVGDVVR